MTDAERLRLILEASASGVIERDLVNEAIRVSAKMWSMVGYEPGELIEQPAALATLVHPEDIAALRHLVELARTGTLPPPPTLRMRHKKGHWLWFELSCALQRDADGRALALVASVTDVTRFVQAERELAMAQRIAHVGHWTLELSEHRLSWSEEIFRIFEFDAPTFRITYEAFLERVHPDDRALVDGSYRAHVEQGVPYDLRHRLRFPDGRIKYVHERCETERTPEGRPLRSLGTVQDVTELTQTEAALRTSHGLLQSVIDTAPVRVFWKDRTGVYVGCNTALARDAGLKSPLEVVGRTDFDLAWRDQAARYRDDDRQVIESGQPKLSYDEPQTTPDGRSVWLRTSKVPLRDAAGAIVGVLGIYEDISSAREAQAALRSAVEAAENANRAKGEFLANMSHEIRTPMNAVMGFADLALQERLTEPVLGYLRHIQSSARDLLGVIDDILHFSRIDSGRLELEASPFSLHECLERARSLGESLAREKDIAVELHEDVATPVALRGDALRLGQVLNNLVGNAVKFTATGTVRLSSRVLEKRGELVRFQLEVSDTGVGMTKDQQARIFEPFVQADASTTRVFGGTGLGLSITRRLVQLMGGTIELSSEAGRGSRFVVTLELPGADEARPTPPRVANHRFDALRALLVEDNKVNQALARALLGRLGFLVDVADNGRVATDMVMHATVPYDIVFMDLQMPEMDGLQATRTIRERFDQRTLPIVAMTANAFERDRQRCLDAGMNDHLAKPMRLEHVSNVVHRVLEVAKAARL